jgi:hypothetical protein
MKINKQIKTSAYSKQNRKNVMGGQIPWHPAFVQAMQLELKEYKDILEFYPELQLTSDPLRIDCVIIKKIRDIEIKKNIAAIFKTWNILEYKNPNDYVSIADFYKVYGYACLYTSLNDICITDLTITFVESHYPRELIKHLKKTRNLTVEKTAHGIYNVIGDMLPIQIIDSRKLSIKDNLWLKNLSDRLNHSEIDQLLTESAKQDKATQIAAYMYAIVYANPKILKETINMRKEKITLDQVLEETGYTAMWEARGEARNEARAQQERERLQTVIASKDAEIMNLREQLEQMKLVCHG